MKSSLSHLPDTKQKQILQIVEIIKEVANPEKIILFGSYAKGRQVEHRYTGSDGVIYEYISDYDFLVVMKNSPVKAYELDDEITTRAEKIQPALNVEIHDIEYINEGLNFGQYFFSDIVKEGILLFDTRRLDFATPKELSSEEQRIIAQRYFDIWFDRGQSFFKVAEFCLKEGESKMCAFNLHQVTESFYYTALLVFTGYKPKTHNLKKLRKQAKEFSIDLFLLFPIEKNKEEKHLFDLLKRGYIDARYRQDFFIKDIELEILIARIEKMKNIVKQICEEKINNF